MVRSETELRAELTAYYAARMQIISGAQSYSVDSGQSKKAVTKASLPEVNRTIETLERQLEAVLDGGASDIVSPDVRRYP